jgi:hypothetical protein
MNAKFAYTPIQHLNAVLLLADVTEK